MKKFLSVLLATLMVLSMVSCSSKEVSAPAASTESAKPAEEKFVVGISQLLQHAALDAATQGFKDVLTETFGDNVVFEEKNASGDVAAATTIAGQLVTDDVDLILANATPCLQAAVSATTSIPILGTSITEYGTALGIDNFDGKVGGNVSGTSDLAPLDQQAKMVLEFVPDAKTAGILYCSSEANSIYQAKVVEEELVKEGLTVKIFTFSDSNDVNLVTSTACEECDVLYIPTDNTAASCAEAINNIAAPAGVPIIAGEENICKACGIATLSINYYDLGRTTGEMAVKILKGESNVSDMPVEYFANPVKKFNKELCEKLNITVPSGYEAIA